MRVESDALSELKEHPMNLAGSADMGYTTERPVAGARSGERLESAFG
jgi:hypothetical protein